MPMPLSCTQSLTSLGVRSAQTTISGVVPNVVFPTGIDQRTDLGMPDVFDIYYGMGDSRIGAARIRLPDDLPAQAQADAPDAKA